METWRGDSRLPEPRSGFGGTIPLSAEAQAEDMVPDRWSQMGTPMEAIA